MSEFMDTVDLERSLLQLVSKSKMYANLYMHRLKPEFFTSEPRKFIYGAAQRTHADTKSHITRKLIEFEIKHRVEDGEQAIYEGEWNIIEGMSVGETPDSVIDKLMEAVTGRQVMNAAESVADFLATGDITRAVEAWKQSAMQISTVKDDQPIRRLTDNAHRKERIMDKKRHPEKYTGIKTGIFPTFDKKTGGFFAGEMTLIAGVTGLGKSTLIKALQWGIIMTNPGKNVLHIANEEYSEQVENKFDSLITEIPYMNFKLGTISEDDMETWDTKMADMKDKAGVEYGEIYSKEVPAFTDVTLVEQAYRELESQGVKIDIILIDHLPHITPILKAHGENDERWKAAGDCKELARSLKVPVVVPTQAATDVEAKQMKGKRAGKLDVYGSKGQIHVANNFLIITYRGKDETQTDRPEYERDVYWLVDCKKNRDGPPFNFLAKHHVYFGKVEEIKEDDKGNKVGDDPSSDDDQKATAADILAEADEKVAEAEEKPADGEEKSEPAPEPDKPVESPTAPTEKVEASTVRNVKEAKAIIEDRKSEPSPKKMSVVEKMKIRKAREAAGK
jgi:replicative DNA helicase